MIQYFGGESMKQYTVIVKDNDTNDSFEVSLRSMSFSKDNGSPNVEVNLSGFMFKKSLQAEVVVTKECAHDWETYLGLEESFTVCKVCGTKNEN